jgi:hypothetical protein
MAAVIRVMRNGRLQNTINPALKTIVPYVAAIPGLGVPMENNVFINANYANGRFIPPITSILDDEINDDRNAGAAAQPLV